MTILDKLIAAGYKQASNSKKTYVSTIQNDFRKREKYPKTHWHIENLLPENVVLNCPFCGAKMLNVKWLFALRESVYLVSCSNTECFCMG